MTRRTLDVPADICINVRDCMTEAIWDSSVVPAISDFVHSLLHNMICSEHFFLSLVYRIFSFFLLVKQQNLFISKLLLSPFLYFVMETSKVAFLVKYIQYTAPQKHESTLLHTYVLNEFLTANHSCTTKYFWKKLVAHMSLLLLTPFEFKLVN